MALIKCPECTKEVSDQINSCPHCGYRLKRKKHHFRKVIAVIVCFFALLIVCLIAFMYMNNPVNQALNFAEDGLTKEASEIYQEKIISDQQKNDALKQNATPIIQAILDDYLTSTLPADDAKEQLSYYKVFDVLQDIITDANNCINEMEKSRDAYLSACDYEEKDDLKNALTQYSKVIESDANYSIAQEKILELTDVYIEQAIEYARIAAVDKTSVSYNNAVNIIRSALAFDSDNTSLQDTLSLYRQLFSEAKAVEDAAALEKMKLIPDKLITNANWEITYKTARLTTSIKPNNTSGAYIYYHCDDDEIYFDLVFSVKNISSDTLHLDGLVSNTNIIYDGKYTYSGLSCFYSTGDNIDQVLSWDTIDALKSTTLHVTIKLPREVRDSDKSIEVYTTIAGQKQHLLFR